jgi:hypothetical protein
LGYPIGFLSEDKTAKAAGIVLGMPVAVLECGSVKSIIGVDKQRGVTMISQLKKRVRNWSYDISHSACNDVLYSALPSIEAAVRSGIDRMPPSPFLKASQVQLYTYYRALTKQRAPLPTLSETGYRVYSQFEEDGMLLFLFAVLGTKNKLFVDIGSADGINSNCANLAINFGWHGLFIDGNSEHIESGRKYYSSHPDTFLYPPKFVCSMVTRENVDRLIRDAGFAGEVDLLSIDIDGNDYWIWDGLECIQPRVVIIETHVELGYNNVVVPYKKDYVYPPNPADYFGASAIAMAKMAKSHGYRLVGAIRFGFNTIYVKGQEGADLIPEASVDSILQHPRTKERFELFEAIKHMPFVEGGSPFPGRPVVPS